MSGLLSLLSQGAASLQATQAWSSTVAQNISNANTPGYARQRAELAAALPAERFGDSWLGRGAVLAGITQSRDRFVEAQFAQATGQEAFSSAEMGVLQGVTVLDVDNGVQPALSDFYTKLRSLAQNPGSQNYREAAVGSAKQLALSFNRTGGAIASARSAVDEQLKGALPEVNQAAAQLATLNAKIREATVGGASPNDLLDARQKLGDRLAELTGATPVANSEGDLNLVLPGGAALVIGSQAATLSAQPDAANSGHVALWASPPDGSPPVKLNPPPGGQLGGLVAARDGALKTAQDSLDQLAFDLSGALNAVHRAGYGLDGSTGRDLFATTATAPGAAVGLTVNPDIAANVSLLAAASSAGTVPGDATNLQALINTEQQNLSSGTNVDSTVAQLTAQYGAAAQRAQFSSEADGAVLGNVTALRASASGVSTDEELIEMQKAQRAYEATAKVISAANSMLQTLLSLPTA